MYTYIIKIILQNKLLLSKLLYNFICLIFIKIILHKKYATF